MAHCSSKIKTGCEREECFACHGTECGALTSMAQLDCHKCKFFKTKEQLHEEWLKYNGTTDTNKIFRAYKDRH